MRKCYCIVYKGHVWVKGKHDVGLVYATFPQTMYDVTYKHDAHVTLHTIAAKHDLWSGVILSLASMYVAGLVLESNGNLKLELYDRGLYESPESYYFFPALVQVECSIDLCQNSGPEQYQRGLTLQCFKEGPYFTARFLHVLLLRLAVSFALAHDSSQQDKASPLLRRRCAIWKNRFHWLHQDCIQTTEEVIKQNKCILLLISCPEGEELVCVQLRSLLIPNLLEAKEELSREISTNNLLMDPSNMTSHPQPELCQQVCHESLLSSVIIKWLSGERSYCSGLTCKLYIKLLEIFAALQR